MNIHHIGYLVDNIENAAIEFETLGFSRIGKATEDLSRGIHILFLQKEGGAVELIQPINNKSSVYGLRKKYRKSPYHICYETGNLKDEINHLLKTGNYILLQPSEPAPAIRDCPNVAFLMNKHIGMIELVEKSDKDV